jgi:hypothetical protein
MGQKPPIPRLHQRPGSGRQVHSSRLPVLPLAQGARHLQWLCAREEERDIHDQPLAPWRQGSLLGACQHRLFRRLALRGHGSLPRRGGWLGLDWVACLERANLPLGDGWLRSAKVCSPNTGCWGIITLPRLRGRAVGGNCRAL